MRFSVTLCILLAMAPSAYAAGHVDAKKTAAQMVFLAELAPQVCSDLQTNRQAVAAYLAHSHVRAEDLTTRYRAALRVAADAFVRSALANSDTACAQIHDHLGSDGLGLVTSDDD
jgi:hypothetical protein